VKVIHIVENLDRGAVENWLVRMLRHAKLKGVALDWTFFCQLQTVGVLEEEVVHLGARVIHSPVPLGQLGKFIKALRTELQNGKYEVMHCHHDLVSAVYLLASFKIPMHRLVHVHNADENIPTPSRLKQAIARGLMRQICLALADRIVGISQHTLDTFLHGRNRRPDRDTVHYYGVDPRPFQSARGDRTGFRRSLNLPEDAQLLLFAGRIVPAKNPVFAVEVLAEIQRLNPKIYGVFVGTGGLEIPTQEKAKALGVLHKCRFFGWRNDVPEIISCCDWFILPHPEHPMEGLGLAVVEAQLAGLRLLLSPGIADDPLLPTACFARVALKAGTSAWAEAANALLSRPQPSRNEAIVALSQSPFDMDYALRDLLAVYE
jgi:glycosyltransferase involved in cell wall biosynthesis